MLSALEPCQGLGAGGTNGLTPGGPGTWQPAPPSHRRFQKNVATTSLSRWLETHESVLPTKREVANLLMALREQKVLFKTRTGGTPGEDIEMLRFLERAREHGRVGVRDAEPEAGSSTREGSVGVSLERPGPARLGQACLFPWN